MSYKSILTVATGPEAPALEGAVALARRFDAHLEAVALGLLRTEPAIYHAGVSPVMMQASQDRAMQDARDTDAALRSRLGAEDLRWSAERIVTFGSSLPGILGARARFSDLVVLPPPYAGGGGAGAEAALEAALFDGRAPVMILPGAPPPPAARIVVAWSGSPEAVAAVRAALPLMQAAGRVGICIIDPPVHGPDRSDPGGALAQWLARHGVRAEVAVMARTLPRRSEVLARHVADTAADLLVMGGYGHSRFREAILGGVTRDILEAPPAAVLMAH